MKKVLLITVVLISSLNTFATDYPKNASHWAFYYGGTKTPSGTYTYGNVDETYNENQNIVYLNCTGAGSSDCKFSDGTPMASIIVGGQVLDFYEINNIVLNNILMGQLSGTTYADNGIDNFTWQGTDEYHYNFKLNTPSQQ